MAGRDAVVGGLLDRAGLALLPAPPRVREAEQEEDQQEVVAGDEEQRDERAEPEEPHRGRHRGHRAAAVEGDDGYEVDEVEEEGDVGERAQQVAVQGFGEREADGGAERAEDRAGQADAGLGEGVVGRATSIITTAPRTGMNMGALAGTPSRRSWKTWPISCTNSSSTNPAANSQPKNRL